MSPCLVLFRFRRLQPFAAFWLFKWTVSVDGVCKNYLMTAIRCFFSHCPIFRRCLSSNWNYVDRYSFCSVCIVYAARSRFKQRSFLVEGFHFYKVPYSFKNSSNNRALLCHAPCNLIILIHLIFRVGLSHHFYLLPCFYGFAWSKNTLVLWPLDEIGPFGQLLQCPFWSDSSSFSSSLPLVFSSRAIFLFVFMLCQVRENSRRTMHSHYSYFTARV